MFSFTDKQFLMLAIAAAAGVYFVSKKTKAGKAIGDLYSTDPANFWYSNVNEFGAAVSGDEDFSLGSKLYDVVNGENN